MLKIRVAETLKEAWGNTTENYAHMFMSSFSEQLQRAEVTLEQSVHALHSGAKPFSAARPTNRQNERFLCRVQALLHNGATVEVEAENCTPSLALEQALSRCRRSLVRQLKTRS